jgi:hypothetical protein
MSQPMWEDANRLTDRRHGALARKRVASDVLLQERLRAKLLDLASGGPLLKAPRRWALLFNVAGALHVRKLLTPR